MVGRRGRNRKKKKSERFWNKNDKNNTNGNGSTPIRKACKKLPADVEYFIRKEKFTS